MALNTVKRLSVLALALCWPGPAWAHGSVPGLTGIYWGMLHPFSSGPQLLALFALALFIQQRLPDSEDMFHGFWFACLLGAGAAAIGLTGQSVESALTGSAIVSGILTASAVKLPLPIMVLNGAGCGLLSGYLCWPDPGAKGDMVFTALGGIAGSVLIVIATAGILEAVWQIAKWSWLPIAVRVSGSWIVAISVLLGALQLRGLI